MVLNRYRIENGIQVDISNDIYKLSRAGLIDVKYDPKKPFEKISKKSNNFINNSFDLAFSLIKKEKIKKFINGPISKKNFLGNKYLGVTEYVSKSFSKKKNLYAYLQSKIISLPSNNTPTIKKSIKKN